MTGDAYGRFLASARYREERARKADVILALCGEALRSEHRVADLGAGTGLVKKRLEEATGRFIAGFELDPSFIEWRAGMTVADGRRLPVGDGAFDFVLLNHVYEHVEDQEALFHETWRVLAPGGRAYVAAGNRFALVEPHYRLPFLSWLPRPLADLYLRATRRGRAYEGIRFRTYRSLRRLLEEPGFRVRDRTEEALERLLGPGRGGGWKPAWAALRRLPSVARRALLRGLSPQWFLVLERPPEREVASPETGGPSGEAERRATVHGGGMGSEGGKGRA